jgi:hypothetical protein
MHKQETSTQNIKTMTLNNNLIYSSFGICVAPTQPFRAALGAESIVCYSGCLSFVVTRVTHQTVNHNGRSRTATSRSQQQIRTKG